MRRVVVTGLGMVTPLGCGVEPTWTRILNGQSGARKIETFDVSDLTSRIACIIPRGDGSDGSFNPDHWMEPKDQRKVDDFIIFAMCAAKQALDDADWHPSTEEDRCATGTLIGSGIGGLSGIADTAILLKERPDIFTGERQKTEEVIDGRPSQAGGLLGGPVAQKRKPAAEAAGDGVLDRRACDRRCQPADRARRCRGDGRGRNGIADLPARDGRLLRGACSLHRFQRNAAQGLASL